MSATPFSWRADKYTDKLNGDNMRQVKLVKAVKNPQTGQTEVYVPLLIQPTISKFGQGAERFQWIIGAVVNGQFVKLGYFTDNQLLDFADKIKEAVLEKRFAVNIMGEQFVEQRINQLYAQKQQQAQMSAPQPAQQPVQYPQPQPQPVMQQPVQYQQPAQQPVQYQQPAPQPVNVQNIPQQKPNTANIPDINTV